MDKWQPGASLNTLRRRAAMLSSVREFFKQRSVLEVDVPVMGKATVTDLNIDSITTSVVGWVISEGVSSWINGSREQV
jgi:lysyl-tRNA synthetase class 2